MFLNGAMTRNLLKGKLMKRNYFVKKICTSSLIAMMAVSVWANPADKVDSSFNYGGDDLGLTLVQETQDGIFKCWAPMAKSVKVLLFKDSGNLVKPQKSVKMVKDSAHPGVWTTSVKVSGFNYYQYEIANPSSKARVCDIWAKCASPDSVAAQITDINSNPAAIPENCSTDTVWGTQEGYFNPFGNSGKEAKSYTDAVIYEMHIRDWSNVEVKDSKGKFTIIADGEKVISHLRDLGITHVQILPSFDYAQLNSDDKYNWGYNPYNYNVPEGRYVTEGYTDGTQAVKEMRYMIAKLHENGIAVNMDVVYNHTSGTKNYSLYDMTVPGYFYRMKDDENYSNGSGCGNEIATNQPMVRKFVVDSLKHWMLDYHVNGFRFDLMGLHERDTMTAIYEELHKIDPNVMVYGEPWTGGKSMVKSGVSKSTVDLITELDVNGVACFNDDFRDALRGAVFNPAERGALTGNLAGIAKTITGLTGSIRGKGIGGFTKKFGRSLNYIECHDNHTIFDRLANIHLGKATTGNLLEDLSEEQLKSIIREEKLGGAVVILAQGTPFLNGGQEFLRTKNGNGNSYIASDKINGIELSMKDTYADVYNTYKALLALRKANSDSFGQNENATGEEAGSGVIKYNAGKFTVYFNFNDDAKTISDSGKVVVIDESTGSYKVGGSSKVSSVPGKGFVILQK